MSRPGRSAAVARDMVWKSLGEHYSQDTGSYVATSSIPFFVLVRPNYYILTTGESDIILPCVTWDLL
jgi:hypothetical protein